MCWFAVIHCTTTHMINTKSINNSIENGKTLALVLMSTMLQHAIYFKQVGSFACFRICGVIKQNQSEVGQIQFSFFQLTEWTILKATFCRKPHWNWSIGSKDMNIWRMSKNNRKQKEFSALFGSILKSIFPTSDWFCLITSHMLLGWFTHGLDGASSEVHDDVIGVIVAHRLEHWTHDHKVVSWNSISAVASTLRPKNNTVLSKIDHGLWCFQTNVKCLYTRLTLVSAWRW